MEKNFTLVDPHENELYTYLWEPDTANIVGVVQLSHGAGEHVLRYAHFAKFLNSLGFIVIGNDHLGHGRTSTNLEHVYFSDKDGLEKVCDGIITVREYIGEYYPKLPVILFGHSMGSFIGRYVLLHHGDLYDQAIFSGSALFNPLKLMTAGVLASILRLFKGPKYVSRQLTSMTNDAAFKSMRKNGLIHERIEWITSDRKIQEEFLDSKYCGMPFTVSAQRDLSFFIPKIQKKKLIAEKASSTAILFISGELDALGSYGDDARKLYTIYNKRGYTNVKYVVVNNARHEIINEIDKEHTYKLIANFMLKNIH